jgi:hypothetical protein
MQKAVPVGTGAMAALLGIEIAEAQDQALRSLQGLRRSLQQNGIDIAALVNMIPSSTDFGIGWNPGMQTAAPGADASVPSLIPGNTVLRHERDGEATTADPNVGYYSRIAVVPGKVYSVSCFILLPMDFAGTAADISIGDWPHQRKGIARVDIRGRWQRIASTCLVPESAAGLNLVLRVYGTKPSVIFSTCWQLEEGDQPSAYNGTTVEA